MRLPVTLAHRIALRPIRFSISRWRALERTERQFLARPVSRITRRVKPVGLRISDACETCALRRSRNDMAGGRFVAWRSVPSVPSRTTVTANGAGRQPGDRNTMEMAV